MRTKIEWICGDQQTVEAKAGTAMEMRDEGVPAFARWSYRRVETT